MTEKKGTQEALIDVFGEAMAYNIATDILHCLNKRGYCIWQTYTRQDIRNNTNRTNKGLGRFCPTEAFHLGL